MEMIIPVYQVDTFTDKPFQGNPAGVCYMMDHRSDRWMQAVAMEMQLPDTAFFQQSEKGFRLRWFTPSQELSLCGHATMAAAHVIWEIDLVAPDKPVQFETKSGLLQATREGEYIALGLPGLPALPQPEPSGLAEVLNQPILFFGSNGMDMLVEVPDAAQIRAWEPDLTYISSLDTRGLIVTARDHSGTCDFISRFFAPRTGVKEDPVTGSAHACLGPYWAGKLQKKRLIGYQASARGGEVLISMDETRVVIQGKAITVMQGVITAPELNHA